MLYYLLKHHTSHPLALEKSRHQNGRLKALKRAEAYSISTVVLDKATRTYTLERTHLKEGVSSGHAMVAGRQVVDSYSIRLAYQS